MQACLSKPSGLVLYLVFSPFCAKLCEIVQEVLGQFNVMKMCVFLLPSSSAVL